MPARYYINRDDDEAAALRQRLNAKFQKDLPPILAVFLNLLLTVRIASRSQIEDTLYPDEVPIEADTYKLIHVHACRLRRAMGDLMELDTVWGMGYSLKRLGSKDDPMFERE